MFSFITRALSTPQQSETVPSTRPNMANHLFGHAYIHFSQIQLKIILNKASIDYDGSDTKEALFQLAQAFELSLSERSRRVLEYVVSPLQPVGLLILGNTLISK